MADRKLDSILQGIRQFLHLHEANGADDRELLRRFAEKRDEVAFASLLSRHGPMVLGVCRRWLHRPDDEDVFQATFMVLVRKVDALRGCRSLGGWLYTVACRLARRAKSQADRRGNREKHLGEWIERQAGEGDDWLEELDDELERLPARFREPLVLCYLEGRSYTEAAGELGWSESTVRGRLARGRELLRQRLTRRGVAGAGSMIGGHPVPALPGVLASHTCRAALLVQGGEAGAGGISTKALVLTEEVLRAMMISKLKLAAGLLLAVPLVGASVGLALSSVLQAPVGKETPPTQVASPAEAAEPRKPRTDFHGDPLPEGAIARLGTVRLRHLNSMAQHMNQVHVTVAFSPDGKALASQSMDGSIRVWETATGKQRYQVQHEADFDSPQQVAFSPDGKMLAATGIGATLWEAASGKELRRLEPFGNKGSSAFAYALAFSPDSKTVAMAPDGWSEFRVVDIATGQELRRGKSDRNFSSLTYSSDGKLLAYGILNKGGAGAGDEFGLWDVDTGKMVHQVKGQRSHRYGFAFSAGGKTLAIASERMICLWDVPTGKEIRQWRVRQGISSVAFSPDGKSLCTGSPDGTICLWETGTGKPIHPFDLGRVRDIAVSGDGRTLAALTESAIRNPINREDNAIRLYDATTWKETGLYLHPGSTSIALSGNGQLLASGTVEGICLWKTATGKELWRWKEPDAVYSLAFSPDGRHLASASQKNRLCLWDAATGRKLRQFGEVFPHGPTTCIAFSADGKTLAVGSAASTSRADHNNAVQLWDVTTGQKLGRFLFLPETQYMRVAFSADGKTLAAAGSQLRGASIRAWDIATGREYPSFTVTDNAITSVALSPDGRTGVISFADYSKNRPILLWEVATGKERGRLQGHTGLVQSLAFFGDGRRLASGSSDTTVLIWDVSKPERPAGVELTAAQSQKLWTDLAGADAAKAFQAILALSAAPSQAVPLIRKNLSPIQAPDPTAVPRLLADLDSDDFNVRKKAEEDLGKYGELVEPDLRRVLTGKRSLEMRRRVERLLMRLAEAPSGDELRALRAVEVLERLRTQEALQALEALTTGAPGARLTREAQTALKRMALPCLFSPLGAQRGRHKHPCLLKTGCL